MESALEIKTVWEKYNLKLICESVKTFSNLHEILCKNTFKSAVNSMHKVQRDSQHMTPSGENSITRYIYNGDRTHSFLSHPRVVFGWIHICDLRGFVSGIKNKSASFLSSSFCQIKSESFFLFLSVCIRGRLGRPRERASSQAFVLRSASVLTYVQGKTGNRN